MRADADVIVKGIALQAQLVDDLLDLTRITGGKLRLDLEPIHAHIALRQTLEILRADVRERQLDVTLDLAAPHDCINADAVRVQQIFWNVLKNAVKFTPRAGAITIRTRNPAEKERMLVVEISDTGVGIEPEMLEKVFDSVTQEEHDGAPRFGGIGPGLAITRRLVEVQKGCIRVESEGRTAAQLFRSTSRSRHWRYAPRMIRRLSQPAPRFRRSRGAFCWWKITSRPAPLSCSYWSVAATVSLASRPRWARAKSPPRVASIS